MEFDEKKTESNENFPVDPFATKPRNAYSSFTHAILATALFRCWHILLLFGTWATAVCLINHYAYSKFWFQSTLLTVIGTVLGFVVSYRTTSSFERYNEGRRLWSQIVLGCRTFARTTWFHVPKKNPTGPADNNENEARMIIEKKSVINLLEAFAVAVKHYLRGEDGIFYTDLYYLVKHLPAYSLPKGLPSVGDVSDPLASPPLWRAAASDSHSPPPSPRLERFVSPTSGVSKRTEEEQNLPMPVTYPTKRASFLQPPPTSRHGNTPRPRLGSMGEKSRTSSDGRSNVEAYLFPARMPPRYSIFDVFPFSMLVKLLTKKGKNVKGKKAARMRAKMRKGGTQNLPLEISLYLSSYIAALQDRKMCDVPTTNLMLASLNQLVDALTGLERILTTPIPFSYSVHLWVVTIIYCFALPLQIWSTLKWITIPATTILAFIFFGFLVAGEEIENPFGYDKNDLNMDHFTNNIIRNELRALTGVPAPNPSIWAFSSDNDLIFAALNDTNTRVTPNQWLERGAAQMQAAMAY